MARGTAAYSGGWEIALPQERTRLVRLCTLLTGDSAAAEDLAQETLVEAWRHMDRLRDPEGRAPWLAAIARNVCLRWGRRRGREAAHHVRRTPDEDGVTGDVDWPADTVDIEAELERDELVRLLDRALALLPPATRRVLTETYVEESLRAEVAARLGMSEGAVAMRLQRGKLALRRIMTTELQDDVAAYGIASSVTWQETRIWCPNCGRRRFVGGMTHETETIVLRCPSCAFSGVNMGCMESERPLAGAKATKPALTRAMTWAHTYFQQALAQGIVPCCECGQLAPLQMWPADYLPAAVRDAHGVHIPCASCGCTRDLLLAGLSLWRPEGQRFWRDHPRIRLLPERTIEADGRAAIVTSYESVTGRATLDVIADRDTFRVIGVHGAPSEGHDETAAVEA